MTIVADASAVASFLIPDEADSFSHFARERCLTDAVHVPAHWPVELANVLWKAYRRKRFSAEDRDQIVRLAGEFHGIVTVNTDVEIVPLFERAIRSGLTAYDTGYLALAERLGAPLLTRDGDLARIASQAGISVLAP